jgi:hypothetical protein
VRVLAPESRTESSSDSRIGKSPKFGPSTVEIPGFRVFMTPPLHRIKVPELCTSANSRLRRFQTSWIREFPAPEKHTLRMPLDFDVSRVMCFPEFPNTAISRGWKNQVSKFHTDYLTPHGKQYIHICPTCAHDTERYFWSKQSTKIK